MVASDIDGKCQCLVESSEIISLCCARIEVCSIECYYSIVGKSDIDPINIPWAAAIGDFIGGFDRMATEYGQTVPVIGESVVLHGPAG